MTEVSDQIRNTSTATAHPNIAFIKYWGNRDHVLRIPASGSISMNLDGLVTRTTVTFSAAFPTDRLTLNDELAQGAALQRTVEFLDQVRSLAGIRSRAEVLSQNNFPTGAGIASSASGFAALSLAASHAAGLDLDETALSRLARRGSGSACRSVPGGFVEWHAGEDDASSFARSIAPADHWRLADCVAIVSQEHKKTGSYAGHALAHTSPLQNARLAGAAQRLDLCRNAILQRDFEALAAVSEMDSNLMHAVIMTQNPALQYWQPATLAVMQAVIAWRRQGLPAFYTIDAGPNVHVICSADESVQVRGLLEQISGVQSVLQAAVGGAAHFDCEPM